MGNTNVLKHGKRSRYRCFPWFADSKESELPLLMALSGRDHLIDIMECGRLVGTDAD